MINFKNLQNMIDKKYISVQKHPTLDLFIYNYTKRAQFDGVWNNETMQCRGLIMDKDKNIVARPFSKFFNLQEVIDKGGQIPSEDFIVTEKMDGSLGILYWENDKPRIATRGSFVSEQAQFANKLLDTKYANVDFVPTFTYLFEIIYPQNRIVVDYKDREELVLLAIVDIRSGEEISYSIAKDFGEMVGFPVVEKLDGIEDFNKIEQKPNSEGYVIYFPKSKKRFKVKFDEYVRLHRLITGVNKRRIWDILRNHQSLDELLDRVPDEFYSWVKATKRSLEMEYSVIEAIASTHWEIVKDLPDRKSQALALKKILPSQRVAIPIVFKMLDNKPYEELIWRILKPKHETPFKIEI